MLLRLVLRHGDVRLGLELAGFTHGFRLSFLLDLVPAASGADTEGSRADPL